MGRQRPAAWVVQWLPKFPANRTPLFCAAGNHDEDVDGPLAEGLWLQRARRPGVHVDGDVVRHRGFTFACKPWSGPRDLSSVAGPVGLLAHGPTERIPVGSEKGWDFGEFEVRKIAASLPPPADSIVVSGHTHPLDAFLDYVGPVACFNPECDWRLPVPRHLVIPTATRQARILAGSKSKATIRH
jgi:hypothetical protein